jgi:putative ABC transport system permease protein
MESLSQDIRYAIRQLRKNPGFAIGAILILALGIGANTTAFSVVNAVLLRPLNYAKPEQIVVLASLWKKSGGHGQVSAPDFHDWHDQSNAFSAMSLYQDDDTAVSAGATAEYSHIAAVGPEFFRVFETEPVVGRPFSAEEQTPGSSGAVLISHAFWSSHFAASPTALGQPVHMFGKVLNIVGVMPPGFRFPESTDFWFPSGTVFEETTGRSAHNYRVVGRLKDGVSLEQAQAQMTSIGDRLEKQFPSDNSGKNVVVTRMRDDMVGDVRFTLYLLLAAVAVVLLIACANVANLLLAKAMARGREIAIRTAIGATRARLLRQLISETSVLVAVSAAAGLLLAAWGSHAIAAIAPGGVPRLGDAGIDGAVLAFALGASVVVSLLCGLAPALHVSDVNLNDSLKQNAGRTGTQTRGGWMRKVLVTAQIALSVVLLATAGLLLRSFAALQHVTLGFRPENVLVMATDFPASDLAGARRATAFYKSLLERTAQIPGVIAAGATRTLPGEVGSDGSYWIDHLPDEMGVNAPQAVFSDVAPGTLATVGIPVRRGRDFGDNDTYDSPFVALINEALARQAFPNQDPIGHQIYCGLDSPKAMTIVGIVADTRQYGPAYPPRPEIFMPYMQHPEPSTQLNLMVRSTVPAGALAETLRRKTRELSPDVPTRFSSLDASVAESVAAPRFRAVLLGLFAALAVFLAAAGVYGVMAYVLGQRTSEMGLRMALGASRGDVLRLMLGQALLLTIGGMMIGLVAAVSVSRFLRSMLFEITPADPVTYVAVVALLAAAAIAAAWLPARRAAKVDPIVALRYE